MHLDPPSHSKAAKELVTQRLTLRDSTKASIGDLLRVQLHQVTRTGRLAAANREKVSSKVNLLIMAV